MVILWFYTQSWMMYWKTGMNDIDDIELWSGVEWKAEYISCTVWSVWLVPVPAAHFLYYFRNFPGHRGEYYYQFSKIHSLWEFRSWWMVSQLLTEELCETVSSLDCWSRERAVVASWALPLGFIRQKKPHLRQFLCASGGFECAAFQLALSNSQDLSLQGLVPSHRICHSILFSLQVSHGGSFQEPGGSFCLSAYGLYLSFIRR